MRKLDKKTLDEIGVALVKTSTLSAREVEKITANPDLFRSVISRAKSTSPRPDRTKSVYLGRALAGSVAGIALAVAAAFALIVLKSTPVDVVVEQPHQAPKVSKPNVSAIPDNVVDAEFSRTDAQVKTERISSKRGAKAIPVKRTEAQQIRQNEDFYALSYAGDPNETERGGRIVRVDVPRSTLFAMGVDVPLENETDTIKADLLIGSDGVTRAIRVVR
jgi:hypothetical protein